MNFLDDLLIWHDVDSSNIKRVAWARNRLFVEYHNGGSYIYDGVKRHKFMRLRKSPSVGRYVNTRIKPFFTAYKFELDVWLVNPVGVSFSSDPEALRRMVQRDNINVIQSLAQ